MAGPDVSPALRQIEEPGVGRASGEPKAGPHSQPRVFSFWSADTQFQGDFVIAAVAFVGMVAFFLLRFVFRVPELRQDIPLFLVLLLGGVPLVFRLIRKSLAREFGSDLLAGISIIASAMMGQYLVGAIVVLMLSGGSALEEFAIRRASSVLEALAKRKNR